MLSSVWRWLKGFWQQILSIFSPKARNSRLPGRETAPLSDTDYEFLFIQLLEGVNNGWHQQRILKFFNDLGERGQTQAWVEWLERFGQIALSSPAPNHQLAVRMMKLGQATQFLPSLRRFGVESSELGQQLLNRGKKAQVWEYAAAPPVDKAPQEPENLSPEELLARLHRDPALAKALAAQLKLESEEPEQVVDAMIREIIALQTKMATDQAKSAKNWLEQGIEQAQSGHLEEAIQLWDQALAVNPKLFEAWYNRGSALGNLGRIPEAIESLEKAIKLNSRDFQVWNERGNNLYKLERWQEAIASWDKVIELQPNYYQAWYNRACALEHLDKIPEAIASYQEVLSLNPDFTLAQTRLNQLTSNPEA